MTNTLYPVSFQKIMQAANYTVFILKANDKKFPVFTSPIIGDSVQKILANLQNERPQTSDLINSLFKGFEIKPLQLVFHDIDDTIYFCRLFVEQASQVGKQILEIDTRPSDGLVLALTHNIPIYCTDAILTKTPNYQE